MGFVFNCACMPVCDGGQIHSKLLFNFFEVDRAGNSSHEHDHFELTELCTFLPVCLIHLPVVMVEVISLRFVFMFKENNGKEEKDYIQFVTSICCMHARREMHGKNDFCWRLLLRGTSLTTKMEFGVDLKMGI